MYGNHTRIFVGYHLEKQTSLESFKNKESSLNICQAHTFNNLQMTGREKYVKLNFEKDQWNWNERCGFFQILVTHISLQGATRL